MIGKKIDKINELYFYLNELEEFLEEYDEEIGIGPADSVCDYDEAIAALRNTLHQIAKGIRWSKSE